MTVEELVKRAIPLSSCPQTKAEQVIRREWLRREIEKLLESERNKNGYNPVMQIK
jgi:hypothetical protein